MQYCNMDPSNNKFFVLFCVLLLMFFDIVFPFFLEKVIHWDAPPGFQSPPGWHETFLGDPGSQKSKPSPRFIPLRIQNPFPMRIDGWFSPSLGYRIGSLGLVNRPDPRCLPLYRPTFGIPRFLFRSGWFRVGSTKIPTQSLPSLKLT